MVEMTKEEVMELAKTVGQVSGEDWYDDFYDDLIDTWVTKELIKIKD